MIQLKNRPFAGKAPTTTQQAEFSIGWRFCPVCGNKLYQKIEVCSADFMMLTGRQSFISLSVTATQADLTALQVSRIQYGRISR